MANLKKLADELKFAIEKRDLVDDYDFSDLQWLTEDLYQEPEFVELGLTEEDIDALVYLVIGGIDVGMTEEELMALVLSDDILLEAEGQAKPGYKMVFGKWVKTGAKAAGKASVGAAKKIVRAGFKAHAFHKEVKKAGGFKSWAKQRVKAKAKGMISKGIDKLKKWAGVDQTAAAPAAKKKAPGQRKPGTKKPGAAPSNVVPMRKPSGGISRPAQRAQSREKLSVPKGHRPQASPEEKKRQAEQERARKKEARKHM